MRAVVELLRRNQRRYAGYVVHLAVVLVFIGFAGATFNFEDTKLLKPGEKLAASARYTVEYRQARPVSNPHYAGAVARLALYEDGKPVGDAPAREAHVLPAGAADDDPRGRRRTWSRTST